MGELYDLGVRIFTDDGDCVADAGVMRRAFEYARALPGAVLAQHAEDPALVARRAHARRRVVEPARDPGPAGRGRRRRSSPATSSSPSSPARRVPLPARVDRGRRRARARREGRGRPRSRPRPRRTTSRSPTRACASFDPVFKVHPPLRTDADVAAIKRGARRRHHRRHRHRPRAARARDEGASVRGGAAGHARARDRARASRSPSSSSPGVLDLVDALGAALVAAGRDRRAATATAAPIAPGAPANLCVFDPAVRVGGRRRPAREPVAEHAVRRPQAHRQGPPHDAARRPGRRRRRAHRDEHADALLVLADGDRRSKARRSAHVRTTTACRDGRGRVQHRALRLPGDPHRPVVRGADHHLHVPAHRQLRRQRRRRREPRGRSARGVVVRDLARRPSNWRATERPRRRSCARHGVPGIAGIDTRRLTRHLRDTRRAAGRVRHRRGRGARRGRGRGDHRRHRPRRRRHHRPSRTPSAIADAPFHVVAYDFGIKRTILATSSASGCHVEVVPASTPAADVLAREPDGVFLSNGPGDPAAVAGAADTRRRRCSARCRCSASASATRSSASRSARDTFKLRFGHHGAQPPGAPRSRRGRVEITSQNHNYAVDADIAARRRRAHAREPQRRRRRGLARAATSPRVQRAAPPRGRARVRTTPRYLFDEFTTLDDGSGLAMPRARPTSRRSCSSAAGRSSSARPASSTTRARRRAGCCATRATASCS